MKKIIRIYWATRIRGFLKHIAEKSKVLSFDSEINAYEINTIKHKVMSTIIRSKILNPFGIFSITNISNKKCDLYASFNRFLNCDKPYFIYLENPTALYHYTLGRIKHKSGKERFEKCMNDKNLKGIIFMSKACEKTFKQLNGNIPKSIKAQTIYPLVPNNRHISMDKINIKTKRDTLELLYCAQGIRFISKGGLEVLEAIKKCPNTHLTIITKLSDIDRKTLKQIKATKNVSLRDFTLKYEELEKIYANTNILLHPTSDDSFALTIIESMKGGCAVITSRLYAIPEFIEDKKNGYLINPKYWFFDENCLPNPKVWNHRKKTIQSKKINKRIVRELIEKINYLNINRDVLLDICKNNYLQSIDDERFGEKGIIKEWESFITSIYDNMCRQGKARTAYPCHTSKKVVK